MSLLTFVPGDKRKDKLKDCIQNVLSLSQSPSLILSLLSLACISELAQVRSTILKCAQSLGEGNGNPLQYSSLGNPRDRGAWQAIVHGVTNSWTRLSDWTHTHILVLTFCSYIYILYLIIFTWYASWFFPLGVMLFSFLNWLWIFPFILHCSCFLFAFKKVEERKYTIRWS